ncbi:MAG TPA: hypothetical protein VIP05_18175 [Burkholderiaceae bacterium]
MIADKELAMTSIRKAMLRTRLGAAVDSLHRRRAADIPEADIEGYVSLDWLEWHGGNLRLTTTGENVCRQLSGDPS